MTAQTVQREQTAAPIDLDPKPAQPLVTTEPQQQAPQRQMSVTDYAMKSGASAADLKALMELQVQMDNHQLALLKEKRRMDEEDRQTAARNAYFEALAEFKKAHIVVARNVMRTQGPLQGQKYADLFAFTDAVTEELAKHGLSGTYKMLDDSKDWLKIACVIKHKMGFSEETPLGGPVDRGPGRNELQARSSTITYLERTTFKMALGLTDTESDDDGRAGGGPEQGEDLRTTWANKIDGARNLKELDWVSRAGGNAFTKAKDREGYLAFVRHGKERSQQLAFVAEIEATEGAQGRRP